MRNKMIGMTLLTVLMLSLSSFGTAHAGNNNSPGEIAGDASIICNVTITFRDTKGGNTSCDGAADGAVTGIPAGIPDAADTKVLAGAGNVAAFALDPSKPKLNFNAYNVQYLENAADPLAAGFANGNFVVTGTNSNPLAKANKVGEALTVRGTFDWTRVGLVAIATVPCKAKVNCNAGNLRIGKGTKASDDTSNQVTCASNPAGGGVFAFVPKTLPPYSLGQTITATVTGAFTFACV